MHQIYTVAMNALVNVEMLTVIVEPPAGISLMNFFETSILTC